MAYTIEAACGCNIGRRRTNNEDNFYFDNRQLPLENEGLETAIAIESVLKREQCYGVFDGMGGENYGEEASYVAATVVKDTEKLLKNYIFSPRKFLKKLILDMNDKVCARSEEMDSGRMGSTAVMLYFYGKYVYVCNVGDSRAFRLRQSEFLQISEDHTDAKLLAEQGITKRKPSLTQHLGIWPEEMILEPYIAKGKIAGGDQYLLCSDGLTDMVSNAEICAIMKEAEDAQTCVEKLIAKALENGGRDNTTAIVIRVKKNTGAE